MVGRRTGREGEEMSFRLNCHCQHRHMWTVFLLVSEYFATSDKRKVIKETYESKEGEVDIGPEGPIYFLPSYHPFSLSFSPFLFPLFLVFSFSNHHLDYRPIFPFSSYPRDRKTTTDNSSRLRHYYIVPHLS